MTKKKNNKLNFEDYKYNMDDFEKTLFKVLGDSPILTEVSLMIKKMSSKQLDTLGVASQDIHKKKRVIMFVNDNFFNKLKGYQKNYIIEHELYHVLLSHIFARGKKFVNKQVANIAMDLAINCLLDDKYKDKKEIYDKEFGVLRPENYKFKKYLNAEQYYSIIMKDESLRKQLEQLSNMVHQMKQGGEEKQQSGGKQQNQNGKQSKPIGNHGGWGKIEDNHPTLKNQIAQIVERAQKNSTWGNMSGNAVDQIVAVYKTPAIDWRKVLLGFTKSIKSLRRMNTRKRPSKRFGITFPGKKREFTQRLLCVLDTSGSVPNEDIADFVNELNHIITKHKITIDIWQFDHEVKETKLKNVDKKLPGLKIHGRGGTCFSSIFEHYKENKINVDGIVIFTDGYAETPPSPPKSTLWVITPDGSDEYIKNLSRSRSVKMHKKGE